ncbi:hypothetical protein EX30DRAFT_374347 [Ascodesmis nigricans]|uniref:Uncharacterized protein n=1 Tax=Ascodesmis nigricans TaxID=341454 RepID=A0A4V3SHX1_9PEZI|nr:hypothetical protein EX30DRAFT_374347 [Ascodesmis nigricans]
MFGLLKRPSVAGHAISAGKTWYSTATKPAYILVTILLSIALIFSSLIIAGCTKESTMLRNFHLIELRYGEPGAVAGGFNLTAAADTGTNGTLSAVRVGYRKICVEARFPEIPVDGPKKDDKKADEKKEEEKKDEDVPADNEGGPGLNRNDEPASKSSSRLLKRADKDSQDKDDNKDGKDKDEAELSWRCFTAKETKKLDFAEDPSNLLSVARTYKSKLSYTTPYLMTVCFTALALLFTIPNLFVLGGLFSCFSRTKYAVKKPMSILPSSSSPSASTPAPTSTGYPLWAQKTAAICAALAVIIGCISNALHHVMTGALDSLLGTVTMGGVIVDKGNSAIGFGWAAFGLCIIAAGILAALTMAAITADRLEREALRFEATAQSYAGNTTNNIKGKVFGMLGRSSNEKHSLQDLGQHPALAEVGCGCACAACNACTGVKSHQRKSEDSGYAQNSYTMPYGEENQNRPYPGVQRQDSFNRRLVGVMNNHSNANSGIQVPPPTYPGGGYQSGGGQRSLKFQDRVKERAVEEARKGAEKMKERITGKGF